MRRLFMFFISIVTLLCLSCSKSTLVNSTIYVGDYYIDITLYDGDSNNLNEVENIYRYYGMLFDNENEYDGMVNVASINNATDYVSVSTELLNIIKYSLNMQDELNGIYNPLGKDLLDIWSEACDTDIMPAKDLILQELAEINESSISIDGNKVKIIGNARLNLDVFARAYANQKVEEYLLNSNITDYILNYFSRSISLGQADKNGYKLSLYGIKNGYYYFNNLSISTVGCDIDSFIADNKKYTNIIDFNTGYSLTNYDKLFVAGDDPLLNDILAYAAYNMDLDEIKALEEKYNVSFLIYKDLGIVYQGDVFDECFIK